MTYIFLLRIILNSFTSDKVYLSLDNFATMIDDLEDHIYGHNYIEEFSAKCIPCLLGMSPNSHFFLYKRSHLSLL